jgi:hypothetical protein
LKTYGEEWRYISPCILDLGARLDVSGQLYAQRGVPGAHWIGAEVSPRAVLDAVVKRKIPSHPHTPIV